MRNEEFPAPPRVKEFDFWFCRHERPLAREALNLRAVGRHSHFLIPNS